MAWESQPILWGSGGAKESRDGARSKRINYRLHQLQASLQVPAELSGVGPDNYLQWTPGNTHPVSHHLLFPVPPGQKAQTALVYPAITFGKERKLQKTECLSKGTI